MGFRILKNLGSGVRIFRGGGLFGVQGCSKHGHRLVDFLRTFPLALRGPGSRKSQNDLASTADSATRRVPHNFQDGEEPKKNSILCFPFGQSGQLHQHRVAHRSDVGLKFLHFSLLLRDTRHLLFAASKLVGPNVFVYRS